MNPGRLVIPILGIVSLGAAAAGSLSHERAETARDAARRIRAELGALSPEGSASGTSPRAPRPPTRNYNHPMLFDQVPPARPADCSEVALGGVVGMALEAEKRASVAATAQAKTADPLTACASDPNAAVWKTIEADLLSRVSGCVGQDAPLDSQWDSTSSALLALTSCLDCAETPRVRQVKCKHARALLAGSSKKSR